MATAISIRPDGTVTDHEIAAGQDTLGLIRQVIGCPRADVVSLTGVLDMWTDEDGLFTQPVNPGATALARHYGCTWQPYHGTVLLTSVTREGVTAGLTSDQVRALLTRLQDTSAAL